MSLLVDRRAVTLGLATLGLGTPARGLAAVPVLTARTVVDRIKRRCRADGIDWVDRTVDTFKVGDPDVPVTGQACTFMATLDVMHRAAQAGANLIVSHEPVFYNHYDRVESLARDPVYKAKIAFAREHKLVVWRFHDHLHRFTRDPMSVAFIERLGQQGQVDHEATGFTRRFTRPPIGLGDLVLRMTARLPSRSVRFVGDPAMPVRTVA